MDVFFASPKQSSIGEIRFFPLLNATQMLDSLLLFIINEDKSNHITFSLPFFTRLRERVGNSKYSSKKWFAK
jgi:hypothetical protein